jgi:serine/threonine protein kinase
MTDGRGDRPDLPGLELLELRVRTNLNEVWRARRGDSGAPVAVKLSATPEAADALRQEAGIVEALLQAGVAGVVPAEFRSKPQPHLVLPWKGGRTFRQALDEDRDADGRGRNVAIFLQVVEMVSKAHRNGFLHGDLKPENVLLDEKGRPWLTDFGMARAIRSARLDSHVSLSMSESAGGWGGTLHYMSPEGLQGEAPTASWDVYALGVMLHEILLGRRPDRAATPERLKSVLPGEVVEILLDALAYSPEDRLPTATVLLSRLRELGRELTATGPRRWGYRLRRFGVVGLAAFFVALRYGTVAALLAAYLAIGIAAVFHHPTWLMAYLPVLLFHGYVRWEGPETMAEASLRRNESLFHGR